MGSKGVVKGGTPIGSESLCRTCTSAHIMRGYRESELVTICDDVHPNIVVPFVIYECSSYYDKNRPSWDEMRKLAIHVEPGNTLKPAGFKTGFTSPAKVTVGPQDEEEEGEDFDDE